MKEFSEENQQPSGDADSVEDLLLYKKMYLRMVRAALDTQKILEQALQDCEEIFIQK